jgi:hypothetical protein
MIIGAAIAAVGTDETTAATATATQRLPLMKLLPDFENILSILDYLAWVCG